LGLLRPAGLQQLDSTSSITTTSIAATTGITTSAAPTTEHRRLAAYGRKHQRVRSL
jgi:hypothetical protein